MMDKLKWKLSGLALESHSGTFRVLNYILDHPMIMAGIAALGVVIGVIIAPLSANPIDLITALATWALLAVILPIAVCGLLFFASFAEIIAEMLVDAVMPRQVQAAPVAAAPAEVPQQHSASQAHPAPAAQPAPPPGEPEMRLMLSCMMETARAYSDQEEERGAPPIDKEIRLCCYLMVMDAIMTHNIDFSETLGEAFLLPYLQKEFPFAAFLMDEERAGNEFADYLAELVRAEDEHRYPRERDPYVIYGLATVDMVRECTGSRYDQQKGSHLLSCCAQWKILYNQRLRRG